MTEDQEDEKKVLNNDKPELNRGVELLLRNRRKKPEKPKISIQEAHSIFLNNKDIDVMSNFLPKNIITEIQKTIIKDFEVFDNWIEKYEYLIDIGKEMDQIDEKYKIDENIIKGCQSRVWLHVEQKNDNIIYTADSDAIMTKGIIALLIRVFSNQKAKEIINADLDFINEIGLKEQLSPTRANGLLVMIKQMKLYAIALDKK